VDITARERNGHINVSLFFPWIQPTCTLNCTHSHSTFSHSQSACPKNSVLRGNRPKHAQDNRTPHTTLNSFAHCHMKLDYISRYSRIYNYKETTFLVHYTCLSLDVIQAVWKLTLRHVSARDMLLFWHKELHVLNIHKIAMTLCKNYISPQT
jgi:hypothetical protein